MSSQTQADAERVVRRWVLIALVYFVAAVTLGVVMSASHDFRLRGVHVHVNLLGWVSMTLSAFVYRLFPDAATAVGSKLHFWIYQLAFPVMMVSLSALLMGDERAVPFVGVSSIALLLSIVIFAVTVFRHSAVRPVHAAGQVALAR